MQLRSQRWKNLATMLFIGVILFNYVNSTMFWHNHLVDGRIVVHSHIYGKAHDTGHSDGGHTPGQLKLLDVLTHILCTDTVIPDFQIQRMEVLECVLEEFIPAAVPTAVPGVFSLRGPPVC